MIEKNISILNNMPMEANVRTAIKEELLDILQDKDLIYIQAMYTGYLNLLFIMGYLSIDDFDSLLEEIAD